MRTTITMETEGRRLPNFVIRMPPDLRLLLDKEAKRRHMTVAGVIKEILWNALEKGKEGKKCSKKK